MTYRVVVQADLSTIRKNDYSFAYAYMFNTFGSHDNYSYETSIKFSFLGLVDG